MKHLKNIYGNIIQLSGVVMLGAGITCEIIYGGDIHLVVITIGAIVFTIGTKVKGH
jgi:uncharacterized membrane protein YadS